jgi:tetratricopeptide (TPR) repeat protein
VGYAQRAAGNLERALQLYQDEKKLISSGDDAGIAANLYELCYCSFLLDRHDDADQYFERYERLTFEKIDLVERGCFYRLKGDLQKRKNPSAAILAYEESLSFFKKAEDGKGAAEVELRLAQL